MNDGKGKLFIVWKKYQRRAESLSVELKIPLKYFHYRWEEKSKMYKALSYICKALMTLNCLFYNKPDVIIIQLPPTPLLYVVWLYRLINGAKIILDCHNGMFFGAWHKWPFCKRLLLKSESIVVHNEDVIEKAKTVGINTIVIRDPLPVLCADAVVGIDLFVKMGLHGKNYVIVPGNMALDEPLEEIFDAALLTPQIYYVFTWFKEKLPDTLRKRIPKNVILTGFLKEEEFNYLFANATAALVLTKREGTQQSGAIEAISLEVPLILSNLRTCRRLFGDVADFVENSAIPISEAVSFICHDRKLRKNEIRCFKNNFNEMIEHQLLEIKKHLYNDIL